MQALETCLVIFHFSFPYVSLNIINVLLCVTGLVEEVSILRSDMGALYTAEHWKYLQGESISYSE